ncbi:HDIG domain-containing protein [bacterium]|nr:HDIG domain-containing protein [bacterium]
MDRETAWRLVTSRVGNKNLRKHMRAVEAVMGSLADRFAENRDDWSLAGLLHDLDYDETVNDFSRHGLRTAEMLADEDLPPGVIQAIRCHPGHFPRTSLMDKALYAADPVTGLIVAAALMHPSRKLRHLDLTFLKRRFQEKRFAAGADRGQIASCEELGLDLDTFLTLALDAMKEIDGELGL